MKELLERWAKVEEGRCILTGSWRLHQLRYAGEWHPILRLRSQEPGELSPTSLALTQAAVQEAIEAHEGWDWEVRFNSGVDPIVPYRFREATVWHPNESASAEGDTTAEALLSAYLTALEAE